MNTESQSWFARRTWQDPRFSSAELTRAKGDHMVSVVLPALNEQATVGAVVASVIPLLGTLVDEIVVMDSGSTDATVSEARRAGARVVDCAEVLPQYELRAGKGEVLWRSLAAATGDYVVFLDSDLVEPDPDFVPTLLGPLLTTSGVQLVKGFYRRPLRLETDESGSGGGRVTELLARPTLSSLRPVLSGIIQPLGGEYAASRALLESLPLAAGYGVEIGLLLDVEATRGVDALAQVNLGVRKHRNRSLLQLGVMARQILGTALARRARHSSDTVTSPDAELTQFVQVAGEWLPEVTEIAMADRPPMCEILGTR